jgi:oligoribonuclease
MQLDQQNLIWIDLEMTGLDPESDRIIEIATIVTDAQLKILDEGPVIAIFQSDKTLHAMDEWNTSHHTSSGLVERVRKSTHTELYAAAETISFLRKWVEKGASPMCGNSICQDRRFMARLMPELEAYFHYRNLDVSSIKELVKRWAPEKLAGFKKQGKHLAMEDIKDSIAELKFYREKIFSI